MDIKELFDNKIGWLVVLVITLASFPSQQTAITRFDPAHGNAMLIQKNNIQVLVAGGKDSFVATELSKHVSWFDRRIEAVIIPTLTPEDTTGLLAIINKYDVGFILLPQASPHDEFSKDLVQEIIRRHIPYRFAQYGQKISADGIVIRMMSSNSFRLDMDDVSLVVLGDGTSKNQQQLSLTIPSEAFPAKILYLEQHGTKQNMLTPSLSKLISPVLTFSKLPYSATIAKYAHSWFMKCVHETDLPFLQHYCMN
jgi:beta-lactamase superfamily II metal-dependent hydrolase